MCLWLPGRPVVRAQGETERCTRDEAVAWTVVELASSGFRSILLPGAPRELCGGRLQIAEVFSSLVARLNLNVSNRAGGCDCVRSSSPPDARPLG